MSVYGLVWAWTWKPRGDLPIGNAKKAASDDKLHGQAYDRKMGGVDVARTLRTIQRAFESAIR